MDPHTLFADIAAVGERAFNGHAYKSAGHKIIAMKATEGVGFTDPGHGPWAHAAHAAGLAVVHYHFCHPDQNPVQQARHFWAVVEPRYIRGRDRLAADLEIGDPKTAARWLTAFERELARLTHAGPSDQLLGYTYQSYFDQAAAAGAPLELASRAWWIAAWGALMRERAELGHGQFLWAQQYTDGRAGPDPHVFAGVIGRAPGGVCDGSVINKRSLSLIERALGGHHATPAR